MARNASSKFFTEWLWFTLEPRQKSSSMASVHTQGQKSSPFGLALICLGYETKVEYKKQPEPKALRVCNIKIIYNISILIS